MFYLNKMVMKTTNKRKNMYEVVHNMKKLQKGKARNGANRAGTTSVWHEAV